MTLSMARSRIDEDGKCHATFRICGSGQIEDSERARMGPDHDRELARGWRRKHQFEAARPGAASQRARFDVGDQEAVGKRRAHRPPGFLATGARESFPYAAQ